MRKLIAILFIIISMSLSSAAFAILNMELTRGMSGAVPITIMPFAIAGQAPTQDVSAIVGNDLRNSGRFNLKGMGADYQVAGNVQQLAGDRYEVSYQLSEKASQSILIDRKYTVPSQQLRSLAHHISDSIFQQITGIRGVFSTRLAYIVVQRSSNAPTRFILEIADQDGYNPRPLLVSNEPIMSPAWSPDGKKVAYVSFENRRSSIYIENVSTGDRQLVSSVAGINGAPAWSADGRKLALVLSKSGSPNIYVLDLMSRQLTQLTNDYYINTEPSWSPDGRTLVFTSNRSGNPQIYQINLASHAVNRVTYEGKYNARASFTPDGNRLVVLNQTSGLFNIGTLDLDSGIFRVLTNSGTDSESPSIAPNGSMILFGTLYNGRSVLGMVATDGSVQLRLPTRSGEVQDPAWSPFLS